MSLTPRKDLTTATAVEYIDGTTVITADNLNKTQRTVLYNSQQIDELETGKQNAENGKGLSTNDYTTAEKAKLAGIEAGAQVNPDLSGYAKQSNVDDLADDIVSVQMDVGNLKSSFEADAYITDTETSKRYTITRSVVNGYLVETFTEVTA